MELQETILGRRSVRKYKNKKVEERSLLNIIEAGNNAPSHCNTQGWRFIILEDKSVRKKLVELDAASFILDAPLAILVLYNNRSDNLEYMDYVQSASACIQNMLLTAQSIGISGCWVCHLPPKKEIRKLLIIPNHYDPIAVVTMGYADYKGKAVERMKNAKELISYNYFNFDENQQGSDVKLGLKRIGRKMYYKLPFRKHIRKKINDVFERRFE